MFVHFIFVFSLRLKASVERELDCNLQSISASIEAACPKTLQYGKPSFKKTSTSPLFEIARVFVRLDHVASVIVNANHSVIRTAVKLGEAYSIADCVRFGIPQCAEWQHVGNQIDTTFIFCGVGLGKRANSLVSYDGLPQSSNRYEQVAGASASCRYTAKAAVID
jgi:hypothetical protein